MRFKFESEPVEVWYSFATIVDDDEEFNDTDMGDDVRVRSRDVSNDAGTRSRAGGDGAVDAFKLDELFFCVANWCLQGNDFEFSVN